MARGNSIYYARSTGHFQNDSIVCKVLSFDTPNVDEGFFRQRLASAINYRWRMGLKSDGVFRMVHAEGDYLPGLVCDWYNGVLVVQAHSVGMHRLVPMLTQLFVELLAPYGIKAVFDKSSATCPGGATDGYVWGIEPQSSAARRLLWQVGSRHAVIQRRVFPSLR